MGKRQEKRKKGTVRRVKRKEFILEMPERERKREKTRG